VLGIRETTARKIVLYAPNWEKTSALHRYGESVFEAMKDTEYIFLVKLHYMSLLPGDRLKSDDHVDWRPLLEKYAREENIRVTYDSNIDPYLSLSDIMVTDYGGAALEFMCTGKPIVYLDCPEFFEMRGREIMEYCRGNRVISFPEVGKHAGDDPRGLSGDDSRAALQKEMIGRLLFNTGKARRRG
jgi:CDP-glycerol glycerophosphotransferase (TagB/SpsB family)